MVMSAGDRKKREQLVTAFLVIVVLALAMLDTGAIFVRLDASRNKMFSISDVSKRIARELPDRVAITYYMSDKLASRYPFPQQIKDMLGEYAIYSGGRITLSVVDPAASKTPIQPESLGIAARQMQVVEKQEVNLATIYSGIVIQYLDKVESLPFVSDVVSLEYEVSSRIRTLVSGKNRTVGILLGDGRKSLDNDYRYLMQELQSQFTVQPIQPGADIPPGLSTLFVIGNRDLDEYDLFPVDQYIMAGGKALFAVDTIDVDLAQQLRAQKVSNTAVVDMLASYGVRVMDELVLDSSNKRISFRYSQNQIMMVNYPHWIAVTDKTVSKDNPITARFAGLDLYWPCPLEEIARQGVTEQALVSTTTDAWVMKDTFETNPALSQTPAVQDTGQRGQYTVALTLSGTFASYFKDRPAPTRPGEKARAGSPLASSPSTRLVVVGDVDFASDLIEYTQANYNLPFLSNCAEWLGMEDDLLAIKTRSQVDVRLNAISDPALKSRAMLSAQIINVAVVPLLVAAFGIIRLAVRRRKRGEK
jgi:gliding-associated putative ABC transporter substrate-binding component GldG